MALLFLLPAMVEGQKIQLKDRGPWEISAFAGGFDDDWEFDPDGSDFFIDPDQNVLFGLGFNYHLPFDVGPFGTFLGLDGRFVPLDIVPQATTPAVTDLNTYFISPLFGISLPLHERFDIYGVGGVTGASWNPEVGDSEIDFGFTYGGGAHLYLKENIALFGDFRMFQVPTAMEDVTMSVVEYSADETFWGYSISGGISYFFGTKDTDKDGVKDPDDACPETPPGVEVDERGCPLDDDGDGVPNYQDDCPNTPAGAPVDAAGCPLDSDGDGVPDYQDRCPNTPRGTEVDSQGCPIPPPPPPPVRSYTFEDVYFDFDSAVLTDEGEAKLREIGGTIITIEDPDIEVHGHTDATGPEEYNMALSHRRAVSVRDFLVENFSQLSENQFTVRDFGEGEPVATNDTREGRAQNRRVEIKIIPS
jgi:OOP family OmpA-OmpF porin